MRSLLEVGQLDDEDLQELVAEGVRYRTALDGGEAVSRTLVGRTVANIFFEASTRTQLSFDLAAQRLGANVLNFNEVTSSTSKGESLRDTVETVAAMGADVIVIRHKDDGAPGRAAEWSGRHVVNAGEGTVAHPTQALLDTVTLVRHFGDVAGIRVGMVGDVAHSRVAASLWRTLTRFDVDLVQIAPARFQLDEDGLETSADFDATIGSLDVVYLLRVQVERGATIDSAYIDRYQLNRARFEALSPTSVVMHPGPVNRDVEIESSLLDEKRSLVLEQVANGVPTRMAVLEWVVNR